MKKELAFEIKRKSVHVLGGLLLVLLAWYMPQPHFRLVLTGILLCGILLSVLVRTTTFPFISKVLDVFERKQERVTFPGKAPIMLIAGALITSFFVNNLLVIAGLLVIIIGDTLGHVLGIRYGRITIPWDTTKHLEGRIIGVFATWIVLILLWESIFIRVAYLTLLWGVCAGMLVESLPLKKIGLDDNLIVPIVTALTIYFLTPALV